MQFFGNPADWDAPATEGKTFLPAPTDQTCGGGGCGEPILDTDTGVIIGYLRDVGDFGWLAIHKRCYFRMLGIDKILPIPD